MSSENSSTTNHRLRHFGFYRTIDARTEEFLKLSKKRQFKQGCACAAVSTAITVTIVVVILLIYEYAISVESSAVQRMLQKELNDHPKAEKLDRSHFGFDQDYYERMPLLVNALQENNYIDPSVETPIKSIKKDRKIEANDLYPTTISTVDYYNLIRRTSPKPFNNYEYRYPTPAPFSKTYGSKHWLDNYRNTQRLRNLQQLVKYLEKTINAKIGNSYEDPQSQHAFSGFVPQQRHENNKDSIDLSPQSSYNIDSTFTPKNHLFDPLQNFKPQSPGEVNQLAESSLNFFPSTPSVFRPPIKTTKIAMFRPITYRKRHCIGVICDKNHNQRVFPFGHSFNEERSTESPLGTTKSFSMMVNLYPLRSTVSEYGTSDPAESAPTTLDQVYLTTSRPKVQFRRKLSIPIRHTYLGYKRPRSFEEQKENINNDADVSRKSATDSIPMDTKLFIHANIMPQFNETMNFFNATDNNFSVAPDKQNYTTNILELSADNVEDVHVGSSGIIPIDSRSNFEPSLHFETTVSNTDPYIPNTKPDTFKFSAEDAKIPEQYLKIRDDYDEIEYKPSNKNSYVNIRTSNNDALIQIRNDDIKNIDENSTEENTEKTMTTSQINGHYKSVNQNSQNINDWISNKTDTTRKIRLQSSIGDFRTPSIPGYVEIKRNNTYNGDDE